jgi:hypothetical protein
MAIVAEAIGSIRITLMGGYFGKYIPERFHGIAWILVFSYKL